MQLLKQSQTAQALVFLMIDSSDHLTGKAGLTPTVTLSKNGGAFASPAGAVTGIANGWYKVAGNATDTATLGALVLHAEAAGADPVDVVFEVVAFDPQDAVRMGQTALPNASAAANGGLPTVNGSNFVAGVVGNVGGNVVGSVASVVGAVGSVTGSVASVTNDVSITQAAADKVWGSANRTLSNFGTLIADIWAYATRTLTNFQAELNTYGAAKTSDIPEPAGTGPYTVTVDAGTPGAAVSLSEGIDVLRGTTGDDGTLELHPATLGAHALIVTKASYAPISRTETLTDEMTIDAELQAIVITPPSAPNLATVVFRAIDFGVAAPNIKVRFTPVARGPFAIDGAFETDHQVEVTTDENGQAAAELYPASVLTANGISPAQYVMESKQCGNLRKIIEVPDEGGLVIGMVVTS